MHRTHLLGIALASLTAPLQAQSVTIVAGADATLYQSQAGDVANGAGDYFFIGTTLREDNVRRSVLRFDLSPIPPTGLIDAVRLEVHASRVQAGPYLATLHGVTSAWTEGASDPFGDEGQGDPPSPGDATWLHTSFPGTLWSSAGGDFDPTVLTSATIAEVGSYTFPSAAPLVALARLWLDAPSSNHGLLIKGDESINGTAKRFDSRTNPVGGNRPRLIVDYHCPADFNHDTFINADDYDAFASPFDLGDIHADINQDGFVNGDDFDRFASSFDAGC